MFKKLTLASAALAIGATALVPAAPAAAQRYEREYQGGRYDQDYDSGYRGDHGYRGDGGYRGDRGYRGDGGYRVYDRGSRNYRARQRCDDGDGGTIIGAIAGGLLGRSISGRGDHLVGTVLGAGAGALAGRAIDRSDRPGYCHR